jgi:pimeloyl-ACP methyl ester carboxylesterase
MKFCAELSFRLTSTAPKLTLLSFRDGPYIAARAWATHPDLLKQLRNEFSPFPETIKEQQEFQSSIETSVRFDLEPIKPSPSSVVKKVIALHGWLDNAASWDFLLPRVLQKWHRTVPDQDLLVVAIDLDGHGFSSHRPWPSGYPITSYAESVQRVISALKWNTFGVLAHSM